MHVVRQGVPVTHAVSFEYRQVSPVLCSELASGRQWTNSLLSALVVRLETLSRHLDAQSLGTDQLFDSLVRLESCLRAKSTYNECFS